MMVGSPDARAHAANAEQVRQLEAEIATLRGEKYVATSGMCQAKRQEGGETCSSVLP